MLQQNADTALPQPRVYNYYYYYCYYTTARVGVMSVYMPPNTFMTQPLTASCAVETFLETNVQQRLLQLAMQVTDCSAITDKIAVGCVCEAMHAKTPSW